MYLVGNVPQDTGALPAFMRAEFLRIARELASISGAQWRSQVIEVHDGVGTGLAASWAVFRGNTYGWSFTGSGGVARVWGLTTIPNDYKAGTDVYLHIHWAQATVSAGNVRWETEVSYAKAHNQTTMPAPVSNSVTTTASGTQYQLMTSEIQLSAASPAASQFDSDVIEPDGCLTLRLSRDSGNAADTSGTAAFVLGVSLYYQATLTGRNAKVPPF